MARGRGQKKPALPATTRASKPRKAKENREAVLIDSPFIPHKKKTEDMGIVARNLLVELNADAAMHVDGGVFGGATQLFKKPGDLLLAFGLDHKSDVLSSHLPRVQTRRDPRTWSDPADPSVRKVLAVLRLVVDRVLSVFCGASEGAIDALRQRMAADQVEQANQSRGVEKAARFLVSATRGSVEKRAVRAFLCASLSFSEVSALKATVTGFTMSRTSFTKGKEDFRAMTTIGSLEVQRRSLARYDERVVEDAVSFILSPDFISFLSWGTKSLRIDGVRHLLPAITRKHSKVEIYRRYAASDRDAKLSQSTVFQLVSSLTAGSTRARQAVDYVAGFLVYDSFELLERIVQTLSMASDERNELKSRAERAKAYLKYGFDYHIREPECQCLLADRVLGLQRTPQSASVQEVCSQCRALFGFFDKIKAVCSSHEAHQSTLDVIDNCAERARLFLGHRVRVVNQQIVLQRVVDDMKARCVEARGSDEAVVLLDFKMKFDPLYYREKTVEHYGKRGISWHGAMVHHWVFSDNEGTPETTGERIYIDQVADGDGKQDKESVISILEAVLIRVIKDLPHIKRITLQSDNASCYSSAILLMFLPFLSARYGVKIHRFIHTETQDGKSVLDAHFARAMAVVKAWVHAGNNCVTPAQLVMALKKNGGLPNCIVELIEHDRQNLKKLVDSMANLEKSARRFIGRANDVHIELRGDLIRPERMTHYRDCPDFTLRVFDYSEIGSGRTVLCSPFSQEATLLSGEPAVGDVEEDEVDVAGQAGDEEDDSDDEEDGQLVETSETFIEPHTAEGCLTGIQIVTQGQLFRRARNWRRLADPVARVTDSPQQESRKLLAFAVRRAMHLHAQGVLGICNPRTMLVSEDSALFTLPQSLTFGCGWAIRQRRGQMYGQRYATGFADAIRELFERGEQDKSRKMGPGQMLEHLQREHPQRFDLPSEGEIRQEIAKLLQKARKRVESTAAGTATGRKRATAEFQQFFDDLLAECPDIAPSRGLKRFRDEFSEPELTDNQIKGKISNMKQAAKRLRSKDQ